MPSCDRGRQNWNDIKLKAASKGVCEVGFAVGFFYYFFFPLTIFTGFCKTELNIKFWLYARPRERGSSS